MMIREMQKTDYEAAVALWRITPHVGLRAVDDSLESFEAFLKRNEGLSFVAEESGELTGTMMGGYDGKRGFIYHAAVREDQRGAGLGKALVERVERALLDLGATRISLVCAVDNEAGNAFWQHLGFAVKEHVNLREKLLDDSNVHIK